MTHKANYSSEVVWESSAGPDQEAGGWALGRRGAGLLLGLLLAGVYSLAAATIDVVVMRDVPLRLDWPAIWLQVGVSALGGAALGALTAWPEAGWRGVLIGGAAFIGWYFLQLVARLQASALLFLPLFLPLLIMCLPIAGLLRWLTARQEQALALAGWPRGRALLVQAGLILAIGGLAGSWAQMTPAAQEAVRRVNRMVAHALAAPAETLLPAALRSVPEIRDHAASPYALEQRPIPGPSNQIDVRVTFADGYVISCATDLQLGWTDCRPGGDLLYGGAIYDPTDQR